MIENDDPEALSRLADNTYIKEILMCSYILKTIKQIIIIMNVSYFVGMFWWILCVFEEDYTYGVNFASNPELFEEE